MKSILIFFVKIYQKALSPFLPACCRYTPTCSSYMIIAIERFGAFKGLMLGIKRILRCHPLGSYGYDPVPDKKDGENATF